MKLPKIEYRPAIIDSLKNYNKESLSKDIMSGVIVAIVALPLAIAFGIASGVSPEQGITTAIVAGFVAALLGGSKLQVTGPTGAFIVIVYGIVEKFGVEGLAIATFIAGIMLLLMGALKIGTIIKYIPYPIVVGFTSGIAITIFTTQVKDFLGLEITSLPSGAVEQWATYAQSLGTVNLWSLAFGVATILMIVYMPKISKKIPGSLIAIIVTTAVAWAARTYAGVDMVETIGDRFTISASMPAPEGLDLSFEKIKMLFSAAITIALLGAIESLLSATVADGVSGDSHDSNSELIGQGIANIISPIFGGIPATGAIARTMTNINNGGRTPISAVVHALVLLAMLLFLGSLSSLIPMATLAGILVVVSYNMSEWRSVKALLRAEKAEVAVLLTTLVLTVVLDLTIAIQVGVLLAIVLFIRRISAVSTVTVATKGVLSSDDPDAGESKELELGSGIEVYEISGPLFFGVASKFAEIARRTHDKPKVRIIRMRKVPFIDSTGIHNLKNLCNSSISAGTHIILSGVSKNLTTSLNSGKITDIVGATNICSNIHQAISRANDVIAELESKQN